MAKLDILQQDQYPEIRKRLDLGGYDPKFKGNHLDVWMNWTRDYNDRVDAATNEFNRVSLAVSDDTQDLLRRADKALGTDGLLLRGYIYDAPERKLEALQAALEQIFEISAVFWGCTVDECRMLWDLDVSLWQWCQAESAEMRKAWRERNKKNA